MSPEFQVAKIIAVSFGSDGKHNKFLILEDPQRERAFVPAGALDNTVGEICVGSRLDIEVNPETAQAVKVSQLPCVQAEDPITTNAKVRTSG